MINQDDDKIWHNGKKVSKYKKKYTKQIDDIEKGYEPYREEDQEAMKVKVEVEVESALYHVMEKKAKADLRI